MNEYPTKGLNQAVAVAAMCLNEEASARPFMSDVVSALSFLALEPETNNASDSDPSTSPRSEHNPSLTPNGHVQ